MGWRTKAKIQHKKQAKRLFFKIIISGVIGFLLWYVWGYTKPRNFPINHVKIFATYEHVEQQSLQKAIDSYLNNGFFYLNVISMRQQLLKLPWVYEASVQRKWPDTVVVNIIEQKPILQWGKNALINPEGVVFAPPISTFPQGLPIIFGPEERELEIFTLYKKMQLLFEPLDLTVKQLILSPQHHWEILLSNNAVVYLKEAEPLSQLELLVNLYRKITADREKEPKSIDLRYNSGLAVKWE
ncbi:MAG TPA: hypothetical protein DEG23_02685 [Coxiellaceae bacterium]|nr:hypothetical protein [Coxiellaceae bacterium]